MSLRDVELSVDIVDDIITSSVDCMSMTSHIFLFQDSLSID